MESLPRALLAWYRTVKRDLPWRRTDDPYRIWVSEVMLQQTTVAAVVPYYERFLESFPTVAALSEAPVDDVLARWSGLGYYSRARNLKAAAERIAREHGGRVPATYEALRALPGIGDYTAGAVLSIAYGLPEPVLDGNVARVLTRLFALVGDPKKTALKKVLRARAAALVPPDAPGDFNQALMELGATVCTPRAPSCGGCPLAIRCAARARGTPEAFPQAPARTATVAVTIAAAVVARDGAYLMVKRDAKLMRGLWEFPGGEVTGGDTRAALADAIGRQHGLAVAVGEEIARARHAIMNRRIALFAHAATLARGGAARVRALVEAGRADWVEPRAIGARGVSSMALKIVARLQV